jgi:DNA polymerase elongation subunit (family B)
MIFDIESSPLSEEEIRRNVPGFNPDKVKLGNLKDKGKIEKKIEDARESYWPNIFKKAALSPITGCVLCIGLKNPDEDQPQIWADTERHMLSMFWQVVDSCHEDVEEVVGYNICGFDLPFMIRRSWFIGVPVPRWVRGTNKRYFNPLFVDLLDLWNCGQKLDECPTGGLNGLLHLCQLPPKLPNGQSFHKKWKENRDEAILYLKSELLSLEKLAERMWI